MSISSEISRISKNVSDSLTAVAAKGVTVPSGSNSDDLPDLIAQISTGGGGGATTVVVTQDTHGGDIVTITTAIDISNDTVAADKLLYGYTAHDSTGTAVTGTIASKSSSDLTASGLTVTAPAGYYGSAASKTLTDSNLIAENIKKDVTIFGVTGTLEGGGGSLVITDVSNATGTTAEISVSGSGGGSAQIDTGTFTGGGGNTTTISCDFAPDLIYIHGDLTSDPSLRGIITLTIVKDTYILVTCDSSTSGTGENLMYGDYGITGYSTDTSNPYATYSNGTLTVDTVTNSGSARWCSGITYSYKLVKWTS